MKPKFFTFVSCILPILLIFLLPVMGVCQGIAVMLFLALMLVGQILILGLCEDASWEKSDHKLFAEGIRDAHLEH